MRKINLVTLGCPKNLVDSEVLMGGLKGEGVEFVGDPQEAETIIINTCGFIQSAKEESVEAILEAAELKKRGKCQNIFVTGCLSERYKRELEAELPEVDGFWGNRDLTKVSHQLAERLSLRPNILKDRVLLTPPHYAYLKIAEGCSNHCTYCAIPLIRGEFRSLGLESILYETQALVEKGVREIILVAQDTTRYGWDLADGTNLATLLDRLSSIEGVKWIRLLYTHPAHFTEDLIAVIAERANICKYIDLPVQHISDCVLKAMGRKITEREIKSLIEKLRSRIPQLALRTSLIVGFPGENETDFKALLDFVGEAHFERLGVFTYSKEEGTPAYNYPNQIPEKVKQERQAEIMETQSRISAQLNRALHGKEIEVLVDEFDEVANHFVGRTQWDSPEIDDTVLLDSDVEVGKFYKVKILDSTEYDLIGKKVDF